MDKYRIVGDGTVAGRKVYCNDIEMKGVTKLTIEMLPRCTLARIEVLALNPEVDVVPDVGQVRRRGVKRG